MKRIQIYQINPDRDANDQLFRCYDLLQNGEVDPTIYDEVFDYELEYDTLENLFVRFNTVMHPLYRGTSLCISDVVVTPDGAFFCDTVGFREVAFDATKTQKPTNLLKVVYVEPHQPARLAEVEDTLAGLKRAVKGHFESVYLDQDIVAICNEEGKINGMEGNRHYGANGKSILAGPFFVAGLGEEDFISLTDDQCQEWLARFAEPEDISDDEVQTDFFFKFFTF